MPRPRGPCPIDRLLHEAAGRPRQGVASIEQRVDRDVGERLALGEVDQREQVTIDGVHAAVPEQSDQVQRAATLTDPAAELEHHLVGEEAAVIDSGRDANEVLWHHSTRAEVEMADLAVSHLPRGESYRESRMRRAASGTVPSRERPR